MWPKCPYSLNDRRKRRKSLMNVSWKHGIVHTELHTLIFSVRFQFVENAFLGQHWRLLDVNMEKKKTWNILRNNFISFKIIFDYVIDAEWILLPTNEIISIHWHKIFHTEEHLSFKEKDGNLFSTIEPSNTIQYVRYSNCCFDFDTIFVPFFKVVSLLFELFSQNYKMLLAEIHPDQRMDMFSEWLKQFSNCNISFRTRTIKSWLIVDMFERRKMKWKTNNSEKDTFQIWTHILHLHLWDTWASLWIANIRSSELNVHEIKLNSWKFTIAFGWLMQRTQVMRVYMSGTSSIPRSLVQVVLPISYFIFARCISYLYVTYRTPMVD